MEVSSIDRECNKLILETYYRNLGFNLKNGNGYQQTILEPKFIELDQKVRDNFPQWYSAYKTTRDNYLEGFKKMYSEEKRAGRNGARISEEEMGPEK